MATIAPQWIERSQIQPTFGLSARYLDELAKDGHVIRKYAGSKPLFNVASINAWIEAQPDEKP